MTVAVVFEGLAKENESSEACFTGALAQDIIQELDLRFERGATIGDFAEQDEEEFKEEMDASIALVEEDTKNAQSIARSGPTSQGAEKTMSRPLLFPCQAPIRWLCLRRQAIYIQRAHAHCRCERREKGLLHRSIPQIYRQRRELAEFQAWLHKPTCG